jgi:hypothetical protein
MSAIVDWRRRLGGASQPFVDSRIYADANIRAARLPHPHRR